MPNNKKIIKTTKAPSAIGTYSQAVQAGNLLFISGQIPLDPASGQVISDDPRTQIEQCFSNLLAIAHAAGGDADQLVKLNVYLTDLNHFPLVNEVMAQLFTDPYPARAAIGVAALPKGVSVEVEGILQLSS